MGLSKPTVHTKKGKASLNATMSMGIFAIDATDSDSSKAKTPELIIAVGSESVEPVEDLSGCMAQGRFMLQLPHTQSP